ncbi:MAG TPA: hypothetical protein PK971_07750 [Saprospiraceae bacterium]|nr:hypothetical protein [Saprospiraceae bacterium]
MLLNITILNANITPVVMLRPGTEIIAVIHRLVLVIDDPAAVGVKKKMASSVRHDAGHIKIKLVGQFEEGDTAWRVVEV